MTERWTEARGIVSVWLDASPTERHALLQTVHQRDPQLGRLVEELVAADAEPTAWLRPPLDGVAVQALTCLVADTAVGQRIGAYRLTALIGHGGMGTVYRAVRDDRHYDKQVAVKLIRPAVADHPEMQRRFRQERQTLANLEHPCIARLYDGGVTGDGRLYLIMEYIDGLPIDRFCDEHRLTVRQRLKLFQGVCQAVRYSHANLTVHGDLKPANILVDQRGTPKLVDFGIARLLDGQTAPDTEDGSPPATPQYASPEQLQGQTMSTASDVYSLGIILHHLLSGHLPDGPPSPCGHRRAASRPAALIGALPGRSSTPSPGMAARPHSSTAAKLCLRLRGDLEALCRKALAEQPQDRYPSVQHFSDDIERFLDGRPLQIRSADRAYVVRKTIRRNWRICCGTLLGLGVLLALSCGYAASISAARERHRQARAAADQFQNLVYDLLDPLERQSLGSFQDQLASVRPGRIQTADPGALRTVLRTAADHAENAHGGVPEVEASLKLALSRVYHYLGLTAEAETHARRALHIRRTAAAPSAVDTAVALDQLAGVLMDQGRLTEAENRLRLALQLWQSDLQSVHEGHAATLNHLGMLLYHRAAYKQADEYFQAALQRYRLNDGNHPAILSVRGNLAALLRATGRYADAGRLYDKVLHSATERYGRQDLHVAGLLSARGVLAHLMGQADLAERLCRESLELHRKLLHPGHPAIGKCLHDLGLIQRSAGRYARAEALLKEAVSLRRRALGPRHLDVAAGMHELAILAQLQGDLGTATRYLLTSLDIHEHILGLAHPRTLAGLDQLANLHGAAGRHGPAITLLRRTLEVRRRDLSADHPDVLRSRCNLAAALLNHGSTAEAERVCGEAVQQADTTPAAAAVITTCPCFAQASQVLRRENP